MFDLHSTTGPEWLEAVMADFDAFLLDHAACERKASATAMSFIVRYPDREALIEPMIEVAREELEHFHQIYKLIQARGLKLIPDVKDPYIGALMRHIRGGRDERLLDRLVVGGVVEARGCERFGMVAEGLPPGPDKELYMELTRSEARHRGLYLRLAKEYFDDSVVDERLSLFLDWEAEAITAIPPRPALH